MPRRMSEGAWRISQKSNRNQQTAGVIIPNAILEREFRVISKGLSGSAEIGLGMWLVKSVGIVEIFGLEFCSHDLLKRGNEIVE